jgi:hypothetical protein
VEILSLARNIKSLVLHLSNKIIIQMRMLNKSQIGEDEDVNLFLNSDTSKLTIS